MKKGLIVIIMFVIPLLCFAMAENETVTATSGFTDSCGRTVEIPKNVTKISPAGPVASVILTSLAPEYLCSITSKTYSDVLPVTGSLYGGKNTINIEALLSTGTQLVIDCGDLKSTTKQDIDELQKQLGIPCIFISADIFHMAEAFSILGTILPGKKERAMEISSFITETLKLAEQAKNKISAEDSKTVLLAGGSDGLTVFPEGSSNARIINAIGAVNALRTDNNVNKGVQIDIEQLYIINPDIIVFFPDSIYDRITSNPLWNTLDAVKNGKVYPVPSNPLNCLGNPASVNTISGILWLGNVVYPQYFNYNASEKMEEAYRILWNSTASD